MKTAEELVEIFETDSLDPKAAAEAIMELMILQAIRFPSFVWVISKLSSKAIQRVERTRDKVRFKMGLDF